MQGLRIKSSLGKRTPPRSKIPLQTITNIDVRVLNWITFDPIFYHPDLW
jgi:hypothetical protein